MGETLGTAVCDDFELFAVRNQPILEVKVAEMHAMPRAFVVVMKTRSFVADFVQPPLVRKNEGWGSTCRAGVAESRVA